MALQVVGSGQDVTRAMEDFASQCIQGLIRDGVDGYVFKARSPSCGLRDAPHFAGYVAGHPIGHGSGLFATLVQQAFPTLPMADEAQLQDPGDRARFVARAQAHHKHRLRT